MDTSRLVVLLLRCKILRIIIHNRYLDLGDGSNKFGNHWFSQSAGKESQCLKQHQL